MELRSFPSLAVTTTQTHFLCKVCDGNGCLLFDKFPLECETPRESNRGLLNCVGKCDDKQAGGLSLSFSLP